MNTTAIQRLRQTLASDRPTLGLWVTLEAPAIAEIAVALGLDWLVIDAEHGHLDWKEIAEHIRAAVRSGCVVLVRIAELNGALVKRVLDIGADGIVVPWVESAQQLRRALALTRYPPEGVRGIGAERATGWGHCLAEHTADANEHVLVVPIIETVAAVPEVAAMSRVEGTDLFFFGPADFSASAGHRGQWQEPGVARQILELKDRLRQAGKHCGIIATGPDELNERIAQGFRLIGLGTDAGLLVRSIRSMLGAAGRDAPLRLSAFRQ